MAISLEKYHALGNDYLVLDPAACGVSLTPDAVRLICDRNFGFGSDGILVGPMWNGAVPSVVIFNPDGGEAEKSGNGVRIFAKFLKDFGHIKTDTFTLSTGGGDVDVQYLNADGTMIRVLMGIPTYDSGKIPVAGPVRQVVNEEMTFGERTYRATCLSIGNPHCVIPMDGISKEKALALGPHVEYAPFFPNRINMQLLKVLSRREIAIEIYERGAGYTLASGSSSCAAASAAYKLGLADRDIDVRMPGGTIHIDIREDEAVYMTGPVARIGTVTLSKELERLVLNGGEKCHNP